MESSESEEKVVEGSKNVEVEDENEQEEEREEYNGDPEDDVRVEKSGEEGDGEHNGEPQGEIELQEGVDDETTDGVPERVSKYDRFKKVERSEYERVNEFLRKRTYITAREWAIARLCSDFRTETGVEMTLIGENLPELVPFMTDTYSPQAVNQARASFKDKVKKSGATFLYGAMSDFFTTEELDEMMYEVTEISRFLLEVEGAEISVDRETNVEDKISEAMREIRNSSNELREREKEEEHTCPECGHTFED
ncbi:MAG: DUF5806 family protein [Halobacteria archaeon]|nr:DUF5806 family protein [Halobacteria archaeon]